MRLHLERIWKEVAIKRKTKRGADRHVYHSQLDRQVGSQSVDGVEEGGAAIPHGEADLVACPLPHTPGPFFNMSWLLDASDAMALPSPSEFNSVGEPSSKDDTWKSFFFFFLESIFVCLGVQNPIWHFEYVQDNCGSNVQ